MSLWNAPTARGPIADVVINVPGSKSITNRALVLAALADGPSTLTGVLRSRDADLMIAGLSAMGTKISEVDCPTALTVTPRTLAAADVHCGLAGTVMRFLPPVAALAEGPVHFDADRQAYARPIGAIIDALTALGVAVSARSLPFTVTGTGRIRGGEVTIDASTSSQFVSGLLLAAARFDDGIIIHHDGPPIPSIPHINMTVEMMRRAGVEVDTPDAATWRVHPGPVSAVDWSIEPDLSNAAAFLAAPAVVGGSVSIPRWPERTTQPGAQFIEVVRQMGCEVTLSDSTLTVTGAGAPLAPLTINLHDIGELTPTIAAMCVFACGTSTLTGIAHLRGHETDRLAALTAEINKVGGSCEETDDGLIITGVYNSSDLAELHRNERSVPKLHAEQWHSYADHRMATAGALIGLMVEGIVVEDIDTTRKTLPDFPVMWRAMLAGTENATHSVTVAGH